MVASMVGDGSLGPVFLSASVPDPRRDPVYARTAKPARIAEAVSMLAGVVLPRAELVFGGHPAISPLVLAIARQLGAVDRVVIYQSEFFRSVVPVDSVAFPRLTWTAEVVGDRAASLRAMRGEMIGRRAFGAGFFVGGMDGVEEEYAMFRALQPNAVAFPVGSTGGAAGVLLDNGEGPSDAGERAALGGDLVYAHMFEKLLGLVP